MCALTVDEASETYASAMRNVLPAGGGVCATCKCFIDPDYGRCYKCMTTNQCLDLVVPITYSEHLGQVHTALRSYKSGWPEEQKYASVRLTAILWRFLREHESCLAEAADVAGFDIVTTVPSSTGARDRENKLRPVVEACGPINDRFERLLVPAENASDTREFGFKRYVAQRALDGEDVLLVDDTWTTGVHAQSAAYTLKKADAGSVSLVVIGRHVQPDWRAGTKTSRELLDELPRVFDWRTCVVHAGNA
jgi:predicted amidophosphoribosyltransferase